jgi:hypothetical protein
MPGYRFAFFESNDIEATKPAASFLEEGRTYSIDKPHDEVRGDQDRGATGPAGAASDARAARCRNAPASSNQIRAFMLERGIAVRQGIGFLRTELPTILATRTHALSPRMLRVIHDWRRLDQRIEGLTGEIEALAVKIRHVRA